MDAVASPPAVAGRRHHKTLAPGELKGISAAPSVGMSNPFEVLVEDVSVSSDESYAIEVPYEAAMEVIGSPRAPEWSTVARRGDQTRNWRLTFGRIFGSLLRRLGFGRTPRRRQTQVRPVLFLCAGMGLMGGRHRKEGHRWWMCTSPQLRRASHRCPMEFSSDVCLVLGPGAGPVRLGGDLLRL
jgi:hypothetical protein